MKAIFPGSAVFPAKLAFRCNEGGHEAQAVRADDPHPITASKAKNLLTHPLALNAHLLESSGYDDDTGDPCLATLLHNRREGRGWSRHNRKVNLAGDLGDRRGHLYALNTFPIRVDRIHDSLELRAD